MLKEVQGHMVSRRKFIKTVAAAPIALSLQKGCSGNESSNSGNKKPNFLFFIIDDQRNDILGCAGHEIVKTPNIDSIAGKGVRFSNAFVTTSICAASRASILTGMFERSHKYTFGTPALNADYVSTSYPVMLRASRYQTAYIGKPGVRVSKESLESMFDIFMPLGRVPYFYTMEDGSKRHETDLAADYAVEYLRNSRNGQPFSLTVSFNAVHADHTNLDNQYPWPPSADGMYENVEIPPPALSDPAIFEALPDFLKQSLNRERYFWRWDTPEKYQKNMKAYFRMLSGVDNAIGRIIGELEDLGVDDNTIVIYMADNGYYMGNRGFAGKWSHYEESLRIPLIIHDPRTSRSPGGNVDTRMALNIDLAPTLIDFAGIDIPDRYQGISLAPLVRGHEVNNWRTDFFCEHLMEYGGIPKWEGIRHERYVYARYFEQQPVYEFLHDLEADPDELINFSGDPDYQDVLNEIRNRCNSLIGKYSI